MPRSGLLDVASPTKVPIMASLAAPSWEMENAQFLQINWEVEDAAALALTPPSLHPSIPPFASFFAARARAR